MHSLSALASAMSAMNQPTPEMQTREGAELSRGDMPGIIRDQERRGKTRNAAQLYYNQWPHERGSRIMHRLRYTAPALQHTAA